MKLYRLFERCVNIKYEQIGEAANFALRRQGNVLYIFFEGSRGEEDWKVNLDFPAMSYKRMGHTVWFAHGGFIEAWKRTEPYLKKAIIDSGVKKIVLTGYSHGAAIALLCHEYVWFNRPDLRSTLEGYGFGCPRVLWGISCSYLAERFESFFVIRNIDDTVTHLPPKVLGFYHVGGLIEIGESGKYSSLDAHRHENILYELDRLESFLSPLSVLFYP